MRKVTETIALCAAIAILYIAVAYTDTLMKESCMTDTECEEAYGAEEAGPQFTSPSRIPLGYLVGGK